MKKTCYSRSSPRASKLTNLTQLLNKQPLAVGGVFRFNGLLFNDAGTMRMDCGELDDGVAE